MRGYLSPSLRHAPNETQDAFRGLSRARRVKLAEKASTTLLKADQWAAGGHVDAAVGQALEAGVKSLKK